MSHWSLRVHIERLALRCDICHQSDQFDGLINSCKRCANITIPTELMASPKEIKCVSIWQRNFYQTTTIFAKIGALLMGLLWLNLITHPLPIDPKTGTDPNCGLGNAMIIFLPLGALLGAIIGAISYLIYALAKFTIKLTFNIFNC